MADAPLALVALPDFSGFDCTLPVALFAGLALKLRPSLLPYMAIIQGLLDVSTWAVYSMM